MRYVESGTVHADCLFQYDEPVSPHLAAKLKIANKTLDQVRVDLFHDNYSLLNQGA